MRAGNFRAGLWKALGPAVLSLLLLLSGHAAMADDRTDCNASDELLKVNPGRAVAACERLAQQGDAIAQYNLGLMYFAGQGLPQDDAKAAQWFRSAAEQGDAPAQYNLALIYQSGRGVTRDLAEAVKWYRKAAEQGYVYAQSSLGFMYGNGEGVPPDFVQAYLWLSLAAASGDDDASAYRDFMQNGMSPAQLTQARQLVNEWKPEKPAESFPGY